MKHFTWVTCVAACFLTLACGEDDAGSSGAGGGGSGGSAGDAAADSATGGTGGTSVIDAAQPDSGGEQLCKATVNPFDPATLDCQSACDHFIAWCVECPNPYCDQPDACVVSCETTKSSTTYTNALYGCAAAQDTCAGATSCLDGYCK
jgi:hypothetical protein